jgi:hypothetical protein
MNPRAMWAIYSFEMARTSRTLLQSIVSPVISTSLYFVVFGAAIGSRITSIDGIAYGAFIVPGLVMMMLLTQSTANASFGIYFPKFVGTIYELLSAPVSFLEIVIGYVPADFPRRQLLLGQSAAANLAGAQLVQSCGVSHQRISMELLRHCRCEHRHKPGYDALVPCSVPFGRVVDLSHRVSAEELRVHSSPVAEDSGIKIVVRVGRRCRGRYSAAIGVAATSPVITLASRNVAIATSSILSQSVSTLPLC